MTGDDCYVAGAIAKEGIRGKEKAQDEGGGEAANV
jgi:hypothetical protein